MSFSASNTYQNYGWDEIDVEDDTEILSTLLCQLYERHAYVNVQVASRLHQIEQLDTEALHVCSCLRMAGLYSDVSDAVTLPSETQTKSDSKAHVRYDSCRHLFLVIANLEELRMRFSQDVIMMAETLNRDEYIKILALVIGVAVQCVTQLNNLITKQFVRIAALEKTVTAVAHCEHSKDSDRKFYISALHEQVILSEKAARDLSRARDNLNGDINVVLRREKLRLEKMEEEFKIDMEESEKHRNAVKEAFDNLQFDLEGT